MPAAMHFEFLIQIIQPKSKVVEKYASGPFWAVDRPEFCNAGENTLTGLQWCVTAPLLTVI